MSDKGREGPPKGLGSGLEAVEWVPEGGRRPGGTTRDASLRRLLLPLERWFEKRTRSFCLAVRFSL